jgi:hypothetical protein
VPGSGQRHSENKLTDASDPRHHFLKHFSSVRDYPAVIPLDFSNAAHHRRFRANSISCNKHSINVCFTISVAPATINFHRRTQALLQIPIDKTCRMRARIQR